MRKLDYLISNKIFNPSSATYNTVQDGRNPCPIEENFMIIPVNKDKIEIPAFALDEFVYYAEEKQSVDVFIARLECQNYKTTYTTVDSIVREIICEDPDKKLIKMCIPRYDSLYYGTKGAIFDKDLKPLMMMSWVFNKEKNAEGNDVFFFDRPIVRINPDCYVSQSNSLERYISKKIITQSLNSSVWVPTVAGAGLRTNRIRYMTPKVEIDTCPFKIVQADRPSVLTTTKQILQTVTDYIDELIQ